MCLICTQLGVPVCATSGCGPGWHELVATLSVAGSSTAAIAAIWWRQLLDTVSPKHKKTFQSTTSQGELHEN